MADTRENKGSRPSARRMAGACGMIMPRPAAVAEPIDGIVETVRQSISMSVLVSVMTPLRGSFSHDADDGEWSQTLGNRIVARKVVTHSSAAGVQIPDAHWHSCKLVRKPDFVTNRPPVIQKNFKRAPHGNPAADCKTLAYDLAKTAAI